MATVSISPLFNGYQSFTAGGVPQAGGLLNTYLAGTTTPTTVYQDSGGTTPHSNPIVLDSAGRPPAEIWLVVGVATKFVLTDSLGANSQTFDNISGVAGSADLSSTTDPTKGAGLVGYGSGLTYAATTIGGGLQALATSTNAVLLNWTTTGTGATARTVTSKLQDSICVDDFGADPTGAVDSTTAFTNAIARAVLGTTPSRIHGRPGATYIISSVTVVAPGGTNYSLGEKSITLDFAGVTLKAKAGATNVLTIGVLGTPVVTMTNGVKIMGGVTLDLSLMANTVGNSGILITNSYDSSMDNITILGAPSNVTDILIQDRAYTWNFKNVFCNRVSMAGKVLATDAITTLTFDNLICSKVTIDKSWNINFLNCAVQSASGSKVVLSNCFKINFFGGDIEGAGGTAFDFSGGGVTGFYEKGLNWSTTLAYCTGTANASHFGSITKYHYGNCYGGPLQNVPTTSPTTIWTFTGDPTSAAFPTFPAGVYRFVIAGDDGTRGWMDELTVVHAGTYAKTSNNTYGAGQPTRTYTLSTNNLQIALSAAVANNLRVLLIGNPS